MNNRTLSLMMGAAGASAPAYVEDVFSTWLYTGTGVAQTITNGIDLSGKGGMVWIKKRNAVELHAVFDTARGAPSLLSTNSTNGASTSYPQSLTGFTSSGFQLGTDSNYYVNNGTSDTFTSWTFRKAPGFFDVVAYAGTGANPQVISHNLGVAPELIIIKNRSTTANWAVGSVYLPNAWNNPLSQILYLNLTNAAVQEGYIHSVNSSTFTQVGVTVVGANGNNYIAYLFASLTGVSKVGSYTGTGTTLSIDCGFTAGARFVLIKRTDSTGDWYVWDTARGIIAANDPYLLLNSTAAEVTNTDYIDPLNSGFQISSTAPAAINANGGSYIYLSVA